jgi:hypothetical protein
MAVGGVIGYITGGTAGLKKGLLEGAADGFMWGGIGAAMSAVSKAIQGAKAAKLAKTAKAAKTGGTVGCFVAGTLISAKDGFVPIETVKVGDLVWSENPETGEKALKHVVQTFILKTDTFINIDVDGHRIVTTPVHPFWVLQRGWIDAGNLSVGDVLTLQDGTIKVIEALQRQPLETPATVYNFEVEDFHTYYVTDSAVLVHNKPCGGDFAYKTISQLEKLVSEKYHGGAKKYILKQAGKEALKRVGDNPDIWIDSAGRIQLVSRIHKGVKFTTDLFIQWF